MGNSENPLENLKENLPLLSAFLLMLGTVKLIYFYGYFGIDITSYIDLTEVITLSLAFFVNSALIAIPFTILFLPTVLSMDFNHPVPITGTGTRANNPITVVQLITGFVVNAMIFITMYFMLTGYLDFTVTTDMVLFFVLALATYYISRVIPVLQTKLNSSLNVQISNGFFALILAGLYFSIITMAVTRHTARNIEYGQKYTYAEIKLDSATIKSNQDYRYIGKTKQFAFFYNKKTNKSDVFSISGAKSMTVENEHTFDGILMRGK